MSDDKIIDFKEKQKQVKDSELDKFEAYIYEVFNQVTYGNITMFEFSTKVSKYMEENNISPEKFIEMEKKMLERYGMNPDDLDKEMEKMGIDMDKNIFSGIKDEQVSGLDSKKTARKLGFYDYYSKNIKEKNIVELYINNDKNNVRFIIDKNIMTIVSERKIDLSDTEINQVIAYYKMTINDPLKVILCEASNKYEYH